MEEEFEECPEERWDRVVKEQKEKEGVSYLDWDDVKNKRSQRKDLHVFLMLDEMFPGSRDIIGGASHDIIFLDANVYDVNKMTDEQIIELERCGVFCRDDSLAMYA